MLRLLRLTTACALCALGAPLSAQQSPVLGDADEGAFSWRFGVVERYEFRDPLDAATGVGGGDTLSRSRLSAGMTARWGSRADLVVDAIGTALDFGDAEADLLRAHADLYGFWSENYRIRLGRFGMQFGDGRFFGANTWELQPDAWDGIHVSGGKRVQWELFHAQGGLGSAALHDDVVTGGRALFDLRDLGTLDTAVVQLRQPLLFRKELDFLLHWRNETDYGQTWQVFLVVQDGEDTGFRNLWSQAAVLRFDQQLEFDNTVFAEVAIATGDDVPLDRDSNTYKPSLIDFHAFTGRADVVAFANLVDFAFGWRKQWTPRWTMHTELHFFERQNTDDVIYLGVDATPIATPGNSADVGRELDFAFETAWSEGLHSEFGVAYLMVGDAFVHDQDILVAYLWLVWDL